jgi:hypothetical protein
MKTYMLGFIVLGLFFSFCSEKKNPISTNPVDSEAEIELLKPEGTNYTVELKEPIPLCLKKTCPIIGTVRLNGSPAKKFSFGVDDQIGQKSLVVKTNSSGTFSFDTYPLKSGERKFIFNLSKNINITKKETVYRSERDLYNSVNNPIRYLDYYRLYVCDKSNPMITCKSVNGKLYCGIGTTTMSLCDYNSSLPNGIKVTGSYNALTSATMTLKPEQCFSACFIENYEASDDVEAQTSAFCNALCAYEEKNNNKGIIWNVIFSLTSLELPD